jgi:hypothetical protein
MKIHCATISYDSYKAKTTRQHETELINEMQMLETDLVNDNNK